MRLKTIGNFSAVLSIRPVLIAITSLYLVVPSLVFTFFWFKPEVSVIAIPLGIILGVRNVVSSVKEPLHFHVTPGDLIKLLVLSAIIVFFSGIGGFSLQSYDYWGHNTKLFELANRPWPISYEEAGTFACYYYGYYLVPALLFKFFHSHLNLIAIVWSGLGIYLIVIWYFVLLGKKFFALSLFLLGGIPVLLLNAIPFYDGVIIQQCKLYFLGFAQALLWQPHQSIPAALLAALAMHSVSAGLRYNLIFFLACSCFSWGPFVSIGALGIIFLTFSMELLRSKSASTFPRYWSKMDLLCVIYIMPMLIYFMSSKSSSALHTILESGTYWMLYYFVFLLFNLSLFFLLIRIFNKPDSRISPLLTSAFLFLCLISFFRLGLYNDFVCKSSMPALCLIYFEMARIFNEKRPAESPGRYIVLMNVFMFITVLSSIDVMKRQFENNSITKVFLGRSFPIIPYDTYPNSYEMLKAKYSQTEAIQYLGDKDSVYKRYLSPK